MINYFQKFGLLTFILLIFATVVPAQKKAEKFFTEGLEQAKAGKYEPAIELFGKAIEANPNYFEAFFERGRARQNNQRDLEGAFSDIEEALKLRAGSGEAYFERAIVRNAIFIRILGEKGSMTQEESLPYLQKILEDLNLAIENGMRTEAVYLRRAALYSRDFGDDRKAIEDYTAALEVNPENLETWNTRAFSKLKIGDTDGANEDLRSLIRLYQEGYNKKLYSSERLIEMKRTTAMALSNLATVYASRDDSAKYFWAVNKSIELLPTPTAFASRARYHMIFGELTDALSDINRAIQLSEGKMGNYFIDRGIALSLQGKQEEAAADFEQGARLSPFLKERIRYQLELARRQRAERRIRVELPSQ
jgi:tetratricopeptide (TPR) repeat protein